MRPEDTSRSGKPNGRNHHASGNDDRVGGEQHTDAPADFRRHAREMVLKLLYEIEMASLDQAEARALLARRLAGLGGDDQAGAGTTDNERSGPERPSNAGRGRQGSGQPAAGTTDQPGAAEGGGEDLVWEEEREEAVDRSLHPDELEFALALLDQTLENIEELDKIIGSVAENWDLARMAVIDRNILRLGAAEIVSGRVPPGVAINEAIEIAKKFSTDDSGGFVNGILDKVARLRSGG